MVALLASRAAHELACHAFENVAEAFEGHTLPGNVMLRWQLYNIDRASCAWPACCEPPAEARVLVRRLWDFVP